MRSFFSAIKSTKNIRDERFREGLGECFAIEKKL